MLMRVFRSLLAMSIFSNRLARIFTIAIALRQSMVMLLAHPFSTMPMVMVFMTRVLTHMLLRIRSLGFIALMQMRLIPMRT